nr:hypothetical protein [Tanacetum cinerariifolium]
MFKNQQGQNLDIDKIRQRHNDFLEEYFESLGKERIDREGEETRDPTKEEEEDSESFESYQWNYGKTYAPIAVEKGMEKLEYFGINLEKEEDCKEQHSAYYGKDKSQITSYKCHDLGHYVFYCQRKDKNKYQTKYSSYKEASTSRLSDKGDTHSITSDDFAIIN